MFLSISPYKIQTPPIGVVVIHGVEKPTEETMFFLLYLYVFFFRKTMHLSPLKSTKIKPFQER